MNNIRETAYKESLAIDKNATGWLQARVIFEALMDLELGQRELYLDQVCKHNEELKSEVLGLLKYQTDAKFFFEDNLSGFTSAAGNKNLVGENIQGYKLLYRLHFGSMGSVYLAERTDGSFIRRVAIKLIYCNSHDNSIITRFQRERAILAELDHPNITRLLDAGSAEDGLLYYVMEFVDGLPIDQYCSKHKLGIDARIRLFIQVCEAVTYAHQKLILHRDIKPSNILVTKDGQPKLLDFGIAQFLTSDGFVVPKGTAGSVTSRIMTPLYASPEQLQQEKLSTASDQYSLGVLLYKLMTGVDPYPDSDSFYELEKNIVEYNPLPPSKVRQKESALSLEKKVLRALKGDMDHIALKALHKDPRLRYVSVQVLVDDLRRYLNGLPVHANNSSPVYRAMKYMARRKIAFVSGLLFVTLLAGAIALDRYRLSQISREQQYTIAKTEMVSDFLVDLFTVAVKEESQTVDKEMIKVLLNRGRELVPEQFKDDIGAQAKLMTVLGTIYRQLGYYPDTLALYSKSLELYKEYPVNQQKNISYALNNIALTHLDEGKYEEFLKAMLQVEKMVLEQYGENHFERGRNLLNVGYAYRANGQYENAIKSHKRALVIFLEEVGPQAHYVAVTYNHLGLSNQALLNFDEAIRYFTLALKVFSAIKPEEHIDIAISKGNLAKAYRSDGRLDESIILFEEALAIFIKNYTERHRNVGLTLLHLGRAYHAKALFGKAIEQYERALSISVEVNGKTHPLTAEILHYIGISHHQSGKQVSAQDYLKRAYQMRLDTLGGEHPDTLKSAQALSQLVLN